ncbi:chemotaxis protein CheB [Olivibacter sitiensis]|uniref:chemotaxis protein CheB n=1 Tax=Olivibacter sitiensis TaxID=376470 RepID=UPI0004298BBE|nr:chemotaxis protein CheB [Olivibacter sitiensis]
MDTDIKNRDIQLLVLACSAGGIALIQKILASLHKDFPIPVIAVVHRGGHVMSALEKILQVHCTIRVKEAEEKEILQPSTVYFAPGGYHLLIEKDHSLSLDVSEPVKYCRPSIDVTLQSAVDVFGSNMAAVLLSGANDDGADGMMSVSKAGGLTIVQNPEDAEVDVMPRAALNRTMIDFMLNGDELVQRIKDIRSLGG